MVVIRHQAVIPTLDGRLFDDITEEMQEVQVVLVVEEDAHPAVAAGHDMSNETRSLNARGARHAGL
jgi:hypothetical protein